MRKLIVLAIPVLILLSGLLSPYPIQSTAQAATCTSGEVQTRTYRSKVLRMEMRYAIYLPPCYAETDGRYPVLYLMHGSNADETHWLKLGLRQILDQAIVAKALPPMIVVLPFGDEIANTNRFDTASWGNVFLTELMPAVEQVYRVGLTREQRGIGGISRGGFWAYYLAYTRPDLFSVVGGHSAYFDFSHVPPEVNPLFLVVGAPKIETLRLWLDRGKGDYAFAGLDAMHARLTRRKIAHAFTIYPTGEHNDAYWQQHVREYLDFYAEAWQPQFGALTTTPTALPQVQAPPATGSATAPFNTFFVPAVAFPSLQFSLPLAQLSAFRAGTASPTLVVDQPTVDSLRALGLALPADLRIVPAEKLVDTLWQERDRGSYTLIAFDRLTPTLRQLRVDEQLPLDLAMDDLGAYPFAFNSSIPNFDPNKLTRFLLSGVTAIARATQESFDAQSVQWAGEALRPYTARADFFHISNEVSFHPTCSNVARIEEKAIGPFCSKDYAFDVLKHIGVDIVELTGNHNLDFGPRPYLQTLDLYRQAGMATVGGGVNLSAAQTPLILSFHGTRIGMIACNWAGPQWALATATAPGAAWCDRDWMQAVLASLRATTDFVIVSVQYKEFEDAIIPPEAQQSAFRRLSDWGADVVIGSQAHLTQTYEFYKPERGGDAFIHFGLGNLYFDQVFMQKRFLMDQLFIYDKRLLTVDIFVGITDEQGRPRPSEEKERAFFMRTLFKFNDFPSEAPRP